MDRSISQLIDIPADTPVVVKWRYFPNRVARLIERLLKYSEVESDEYKDGIPFSVFSRVYETDLADTPGVGPVNKHLVLQVLKETYLFESERSQVELLELVDGLETVSQEFNSELENYIWEPPKDLAEILDLIETRISEEFQIFNRMYIVKNRSYVFTEYPKTLDEIGKVFGITRERVRQIVSKVDNFVINDIEEIPVLNEIVKTALGCKTEYEFTIWAESNESTNFEPLSINRLRAICQKLNFQELDEKLAEKSWDLFETKNEHKQIIDEIVSLRQLNPIINLQPIIEKFSLELNEVKRIVLDRYPRSTFYNYWVLAKTKTHDPEILKNLYLILKTFPDLGLDRILTGLKRSDRKKSRSLIPDQVLSGIVLAEAGNPPVLEQLEDSLLFEPEISAYDAWLLNLLQTSETGLMHSSEIYAAGVVEGYPIGSISKYLTDCPFLFKPAAGMYSLLSSYFPQEVVELHRQVVLDSSDETEITYEFSGSEIIVRVTPNAGNLAGGVLFPEQALLEMVKDYTFDLACSCGNLETKSQAKVSNKTFWRSFAPFTRHLHAQKTFNLGDSYSFILNFDNNIATLNHP